MTVLSLYCLVFLGALLLTSAATKLVGRARFEAALSGYGLLPARLVRPASTIVPVIEVLVGGLCLTGVPMAAVPVLFLLAAFSSAIALNLVRGRTDGDCGCLGGLRPEGLAWSLIVRNAALALLALVGLGVPSRDLGESGWPEIGAGPMGAVTVVLAASASLIGYVVVLELSALRQLNAEAKSG